jgi:hypothetical protein
MTITTIKVSVPYDAVRVRHENGLLILEFLNGDLVVASGNCSDIGESLTIRGLRGEFPGTVSNV